MNQNAELLYNGIDAKFESGDREGAMADLDEAIRLDPQNTAYRLTRGIVKTGPSWTDTYEAHTEAIADFTFVLEHSSNEDEIDKAYRKRALSHLVLKQYSKALEDMEGLINEEDDPEFWIDIRSECKRELGLFEEAIKDFSLAIETRKTNELLMERAKTYLEMGAYEDAFRDLAQMEGDVYDNLLIKRDQLYYQMGGYQEAIEDFTQLLYINRNRSDGLLSAMYHWRGKCYYRLNRLDDALADFNHMQSLKGEIAFTDVNQYIEYLRLNDDYF